MHDENASVTQHEAARYSYCDSPQSQQKGRWTAPVEMACLTLPPGLLEAYGVEKIDPKEANLTLHAITLVNRPMNIASGAYRHS